MFVCDRCGECCRNLHFSEMYIDLDRGDGVCRHLKGNLCSIYETRPLKCRVDDAYAEWFADVMTKEQYYQLNYQSCKLLKRKEEK